MVRKIALVTGGSRGLGRAAVLELAAAGMDCVFTYRNRADEAARVADQARQLGVGAVALPLDVADSRGFPAFVASLRAALGELRHERLDVLVNNAGSGLHAPFESTTEEQLDTMLAIHLKAPFLLTQALLPLLADGARILNVSTGLTRFALPGFAAYAAAKGAVEVLTRYLAKELGPRGISVNTLAPGAIETDFGGGAVRDNPQLNGFVAANTALGRAGRPEDIGPVTALLVSDAGRWINAQRVEASGGMFV